MARDKVDNALAAEDLQTKSRLAACPCRALRAKIGRRPAIQPIHCHDLIASQRPEPFVALLHICLGHWLAVLLQAAKAPLRLAAERRHQIHDMAAKHPQVLATAALVFLAAAAQLEHGAELPGVDDLANGLEPGAIAC